MDSQDQFHTPTNLARLRLYGKSPTKSPRFEQSLPSCTSGKEVLIMVKNELLQFLFISKSRDFSNHFLAILEEEKTVFY